MAGLMVLLQEYRKKFLDLTAYKVKFIKVSSIHMVLLIELKFGMYIIGHSLIYCVDFGEFRINSFFLQEYKKKKFFFIIARRVKL